MSIQHIQKLVQKFASDRDWDQFHSPKNLAMALSVEVAEVIEHLQWLTEDQSRSLPEDKRNAIAEELADTFIYLVRLADKLDVNLLAAAEEKIAANAKAYPVEKAKGNAKKYTEFDK
jgi:NTP pyrophosphatase (non-canonical NTP hydrolase)